MSVLVTGATGFVGSAVARRLIAAGEHVRVLVRPGSDRQNLDGVQVEPVEGDLCDPGSLARALGGCRALFHTAADYRLWTRHPEALYRTNVQGTETLMHAAAEAGLERIVYTSSVATLGTATGGEPADEDTPVSLADMIGAYKRSKYLAEEAVRRMAREDGLPAVIVNPSTPVGPRDIKPTPTGRMIVQAARGRMPAVVDTGLNIVHVDDVAEGHLLAYAHGRPGERYVLGGEDKPLMDIVREVAEIAGARPPRLSLPHAAVMPIAYAAEAWARLSGREPFATVDSVRMARKWMYFSSAKAKRELGYHARPAVEAERDAVEWFRAHGYLN